MSKRAFLLCGICFFCLPFLFAQTAQLAAVHVSIYDNEDPLMVGHNTGYVIEVRSEGTAPCTNVKVKAELSKELVFVSAADNGFTVDGQTVTFTPVAVLDAGKHIKCKLVCLAQRAGAAKLSASVSCDQTEGAIILEEPTTVYSLVVPDGEKPELPALHIGVYDSEDPLAVGQETVYVVEVRNEGTAACTSLNIGATISDKMEFVAAEGASWENGALRFVTPAELPAKQKLVFKVTCKGKRHGFGKFSLVCQCEEFAKRIVHEEGTSIAAQN